MTIIQTNLDTANKKAVYKMTKATGINAKDAATGSYPVKSYMIYEEANSKGTVETVLAIDTGAEKLQTISKTFRESFLEILDIMDGEPFSILLVHGTSKSGRDYVTCELDCSEE